MRKNLLLSLLILLTVSFSFAQDRTISGVVTSVEDGSPLPGVNVVVKGTTNGGVTDINGNYKLSISGDGGVLVFTFIGLETQEVEIGNRSIVDVQMTTDVQQLGEVVVTALGISREKASLGYAVATVEGDAIRDRPETDLGRLLIGKAAGVDIGQTSGLAGSGTNIIIRGYSSISGSNQPLFIVDGVFFNTDTNSDRGFVSGGATASSRFLDLDPNNIESINILKGLSATVLYGEAGRNGVVLVTTKTGSSTATQKKMEITFNQSVTFNDVANLPDYQDSYGNGFSGNFGWFFSNWGPSFDVRGSNGIDENGQVQHPYDQPRYNEGFPEFIGARYDYKPYKSVENFFQTGIQSNTSIGISKSIGDAGVVNFSYSKLVENGFVPDNKNKFEKDNLGVGFSTTLENNLVISTTFNYVDSRRLTPPAAAGAGSNPSGASLFANLIYTPRSIDLMGLPFQNPIDGSNVYYRQGSVIQNPRWTLNNASDTEQITRYFGTLSLNYKLTDWLTASYKLGIDQYTQSQRRAINKGGSQIPDGVLETSTRLNKIFDHIGSLVFDKNLNSDFSLSGLLGVNLRRETRDITFTRSSEQFIFDLFTHQNFKNHINSSFKSEENLIGAYISANLGYRDFLYLTLQGRNDWTSTLEKENRSIFYPSASVSFLATDAFPSLQGTAMSLLKVRFGYGTSAGYPDPYQTRSVLASATNVFITNGGSIVDVNSVSNQLGNANLKPELHEEIEFGVEGTFWDNRITLDLSLYNKNSSDLIIDLDLDPSTGFTNTTVNAAEINNRGIEMNLGVTPVRGDLTWTITGIYTKNINDVRKIKDGVDQIAIGNTFDGVNNWAIPDQPYGVLQGTAYETRNGERLVAADGNYVPKGDIEIIGDPNPDWTGSLDNTLTWKGFTLNVLLTYQSGGDIYSITAATMLARGNTVDTDFDRFLPVTLKGVNEASDGTITPNNIQAYIGDVSFRAYFFANEGAIFDATHFRVREAALNYSLPRSLIESTPFGDISLGIFGQNLFYKAYNFPEGVNYDPAVLSTGVGNNRGLEFVTGPTVRKYGFLIGLTF
jgi:TonB-linked SusC/RagA family outer membrane protein